MAKQLTSQKYILKISTGRLKKAKWDLTLPLDEARRNDEVISINDSLMLRWIDELNGQTDTEYEVRHIKYLLRALKKQPNSVANKREIRKLYDQLDRYQFKPDYIHLIIDKDKDLIRASKGFKINGIKYTRLLGTTGGVKTSTIVFVNEKHVDELRRRIDNGRDEGVQQVPAKFEAYRALTCSGSTPVSLPHGILVVPDCETMFKEKVLYLTDENGGEPEMRVIDDYEITNDESDGYGLMLPSLAARWSAELGLHYVTSGCNTRFSWEKGMVFAFDFIDFATNVANKFIVKDAWGNDIDIRNVELVLTTSMLKLWKCYNSIEHYLECCEKNHYTMCVTKTAPEVLEHKRATNYQFLQSYANLTDDQINELIQPTIDEIRDVLSMDYRKSLLFMSGTHLDKDKVVQADDLIKALMIEPGLFNDKFVRQKIYRMIGKRIDDAKIGVIDVHGNYSIISGDPYALCQSIFGLEVTGLLHAGEIYNQYWRDSGAEYVACYRAPMTCHNNIKRMKVARGEELDRWYKYMKTVTLLNAWDSTAAALNGADKDGDLIFLTDNRVLVDNIRPTETIFCIQKTSAKKNVCEEDLLMSNIAGFGDDIGKITNRVTTMFDVQSQFDPDSDEYKVLDYRIKCGQKYQQDCIDKAKGIISNPMPTYWYSKEANKLSEDATDEEIAEREFNMRIVADRKPYFMRYIYPDLMRQYKTYIQNTNTKCLREFRITVDELLEIEESELTEEQKQFIKYYKHRMPVGNNNCLMNKICRRFEREFDNRSDLDPEVLFDYECLKNGSKYTQKQLADIKALFTEYLNMQKEYSRIKKQRRINNDISESLSAEWFKRECWKICSDRDAMCDMVLDVCYSRSGTKQFAWDTVGDVIVSNLLSSHNNKLRYPERDENGDIEYGGLRFSMVDMDWGMIA